VAHAQRQNKSTDMVNRLPLGQSMVTKCKTCIMYDQDSNIQDALQQEVVRFKCFAELYWFSSLPDDLNHSCGFSWISAFIFI